MSRVAPTDGGGSSAGTPGPSGRGAKRRTTVAKYRQTRSTAAAEVGREDDKKHEPREAHMMERFRYHRDKWIEHGSSLVVTLVLFGLVLLLVCALLFKAVDTGGLDCSEEAKDATGAVSVLPVQCDFAGSMWNAWTFMADPGTHADSATTWPKKAAYFAIAAIGILFFGVILGFVVDAVREAMERLKKGRSTVVETGHVLVLGWTDRCPALIKEVALACESEGGGVLVVLAEQSKQILEAELRNNFDSADLRGLRVVLRTGSSMVTNDLLTVSPHTARAIIVLAQPGEADKADSVVLRTVLQLKGLRHRIKGHVVAEMRDVDDEPLVTMIGGEHVETVVSHDIVGRLMLMAARQPGLASVYDAILGFEGHEFYLKKWPALAGLTFGDLAARFDHAVPLGIKRGMTGAVELAPPPTAVIGLVDELLVLAADDDSYAPVPARTIANAGQCPRNTTKDVGAEKILMCGWRRDVDDIIAQLDLVVHPGSVLTMLSEMPIEDRDDLLQEGGLNISKLANVRIEHVFGNSAIKRHLEEVDVDSFDSILVMSDESRENDMMHSDSHTLATLLLLRALQRQRAEERRVDVLAGRTPASTPSRARRASTSPDLEDEGSCLVVCEVLDHRTRATIASSRELAMASDFVQSNEFVSRVLAMVTERREVKAVLDELLGAQGASLYIKEPTRYCHAHEVLSFAHLAARACEGYGELVIGFKTHGRAPELNPDDKHVARAWADAEIIVLGCAEHRIKLAKMGVPGDARSAEAQQAQQQTQEL